MKKLHFTILSLAFFSLFAWVGCDNASRTQQAQEQVEEEQGDLQEAQEDLNAAYEREKVAMQSEIRNAQSRVDKRLVELRAAHNDAKADTKIEIGQRIERLEMKQKQLATDLEQVDDSTYDDWEELKVSVRTTLDELAEDLNG